MPFDHRSTFKEKLFGFEGKLSKAQKEKVCLAKKIVFEAFLLARKKEKFLLENGGILVDEEFGKDILKECKKRKIAFAMPVEKSGQEHFQFEYGKDFKKHLLKFKPVFAKVLVRFHPGDKDKTQLKRLLILSKFCRENGIKLMFELLLVPTKSELEKMHGSKNEFDKKMRPLLMVQAIKELEAFGIKVDIWKLEGLEKEIEMRSVVSQAKKQGKNVGVIVLGRGEDEKKVEKWLSVGAKVSGTIGFAVGRTVFWKPLEDFKNRKISRKKAAEEISSNYLSLVHLWMRGRK